MEKQPTTLNEEAYLLMVRWYPNFSNLSMDRQGELSLDLADKLRGWLELTNIDSELADACDDLMAGDSNYGK